MKNPLPELHLSSLARTVDHWLIREPIRDDGLDDRELFDLHAPYQRGSVWTTEQRQALVKSLLIGLPTGAVVTSQLPYTTPDGASYRVIDGKQRIEAVRAFATGDVPIPAWWVDDELRTVGADAELTWAEMTLTGRRVFGNRQLPELLYQGELEWVRRRSDGKGWVTRKRDADELLRAEAELYLLLNGAGTPQTQEDLDRAAGLLS